MTRTWAQLGLGKLGEVVTDSDDTGTTTIHIGRSHSSDGGAIVHFLPASRSW
ncbi:MAG: hypothetical protein WDN04_25615 [Rhodospirillales bacterium]